MSRYLIVAILVFSCGAGLSCQPYTSGLQKSVERADETAAVSALQTIVAAQRTYGISNSGGCATFPQLVKSGALDSRFDSDTPKIRGYVLVMSITPRSSGSEQDSYTVSADPEGSGPQAAGRHFFVDSSGTIHANPTQPATASDPQLGQ
jgi:hypothetical protein